jgi:hypothetical protein
MMPPALRASLLVATLMLPMTISAEEEFSAIVTGNKYRELGEAARTFYVMGVVEGIQFEAAQLKFQPDLVVLGGCVGGRTGNQLRAMVDKYAEAHPESWHKPASTLVYRGVISGCEEALKSK